MMVFFILHMNDPGILLKYSEEHFGGFKHQYITTTENFTHSANER